MRNSGRESDGTKIAALIAERRNGESGTPDVKDGEGGRTVLRERKRRGGLGVNSSCAKIA